MEKGRSISILCAGNLIRDHIKMIERYPEEGMLTSILEEETGTGGCAYNTLINFAALDKSIHLSALGLVGKDDDGAFIRSHLQSENIRTSLIRSVDDIPTSYTDVMTDRKTGNRTFFHNRGANRLLAPKDFEAIDEPYDLIHIGYLLLLDKLDEEDAEYGTAAANVFNRLKEKGYRISVDVVSEAGERFEKVVLPALPYIDFLILNEIEAGASCGLTLRNENGIPQMELVQKAAEMLIKAGVRDTVVIHFPEGAFAFNKKGESETFPSYKINEKEIKGTTGAGDAFCSGFLYGVLKGKKMRECLSFANACGYFNLRSASATGGAASAGEIEAFIASNPE